MKKLISIDGVIVERKDPFMEWLMGLPENSTYDSYTFLQDIKELKQGDELEIELFTDGGNVDAGKRIYNACKDLQKAGVRITTFNKGKQHSIGNIIMLGGQERLGYHTSTGLIHPVRISPEYFFQFGGGVTADDVEVIHNDLEVEDELMLDIYERETGAKRDALKAIMKASKTLNAQQLLALGFLTKITDGEAVAEKPLSNVVYSNKSMLNFKNPSMNKQGKQGKESKLNGLMAEMKQLFKKHNLAAAVNMDFATQEGGTLSVVREEGEIQVGDEATVNGEPDGVATLEDGRVVTVTAGVITSIETAEAEDEELSNLRAENETLRAENESLKADMEALNKKFNEVDAELANFAKLHTNANPPARQPQGATHKPAEGAKNANDASPEATRDIRKRLRAQK